MAGGLLGVGAGVSTVGFNGEEEEPEPNVAPEEQAQYDMFVKNGMELLYTPDGKILPEVLNRLSTGKPIDALAQTAVWLVMMVENSANSSGAQVADEIVLHGGKELFEQLVEIAESAKIHTFKEGEMQGAWYNALDMYREANSDEGGRFNPEEAAEEFSMLNAAAEEGRPEEVLPGFEQAERAFSMAAEKDGPPEGEEEA